MLPLAALSEQSRFGTLLHQYVSIFLPFALLRASTLRPFFVDILFIKPCSFFLWSFLGWYVLFTVFLLLTFRII